MGLLKKKFSTLRQVIRICWEKYTARLIEAFLCCLPVRRNRIVYSSFTGKNCSCNPRAIFEYLIEHEPDTFRHVWLIDFEKNKTIPESVRQHAKCVPFGSFRAKYYQATSGFWVLNHRNTHWFRKKKNQFYLQTWHGDIGFKAFDRQLLVPGEPESAYTRKCRVDSAMLGAILAGSRWGKQILLSSFLFNENEGDCWLSGSPRNDVLFSARKDELYRSIREQYGLDASRKICLFAPTFRKGFHIGALLSNDSGSFFDTVLNDLQGRFGGEWVIFLRVHPACFADVRNFDFLDGQHILDASEHGDMAELIAAADAMISDYSSSPFDFILTGKPCWLYFEDYEEYSKQTKIIMDLQDLRLDMCRDLPSLSKAIRSFDPQTYRKNVQQMLDAFGSVESGNACAYVAERFKEMLKNNR